VTNTKLTIVIPAYNYARLLPRAISSVYSQLADADELIVVDDGSTDNTLEVLQSLAGRIPRLCIHQQKNAGAAAARNTGIDLSTGEHLIFLDADDELLPNALDAFRTSIRKYPDAGMHIASTIAIFEDGREKLTASPVLAATPEQRFLDYLHKKLSLANGATAMHRKIFDLLRYPHMKQTEDIPVFAAALANFDAVVVPSTSTKIYKHSTSRRHNIDAALATGEQLVAEIFDKDILPKSFKKYRQDYAAKRALSLFRMCYKVGDKQRAKAFFIKAWRLSISAALSKPSYFLKFIRCYF
jgi:glycosyltransferase involved in cell wall biosynthesis